MVFGFTGDTIVISVQSLDSDEEQHKLIEQIKSGIPAFHQLLEVMRDIHCRKNADYASKMDPLSNIKSATRIGLKPWVGCIVRLQDKWSRIEVLIKKLLNTGEGPEVKDESLIDTFMDNAIYSLMFIIIYLQEQIDEELTPKKAFDIFNKE